MRPGHRGHLAQQLLDETELSITMRSMVCGNYFS